MQLLGICWCRLRERVDFPPLVILKDKQYILLKATLILEINFVSASISQTVVSQHTDITVCCV